MSGGNEREGLRERLAEILDEYRKSWDWESDHPIGIGTYKTADRILSLLTQAQEPVGYVVVNAALVAQERISLPYPGTLYRSRELAQKNADLRNDQEKVFNGTATYTVEPVGASPVASAKEPVAWRIEHEDGRWYLSKTEPDAGSQARDRRDGWRTIPLYASPVASACPTCNASGSEPCAYPTENAKRLMQRVHELEERLRATPTEEQERRTPESEEGGDG